MKHKSNRKKWTLLAVTALAAAGALTSCSRQQDADDVVVARVGAVEITAGDFRAAMERRGGDVAQVFEDYEIRRALLDELIRFEVLAESARKQGVFDDPGFQRTVKQMAVARLQQQALEASGAAAEVGPDEVRAYYESNAEAFRTPSRIQAALIYVAVSPKASAGKKSELARKADDIRVEALGLPDGTRNLGYLAAKYSDDQATRYKGGNCGWINRSAPSYRWPSNVVEAAFALQTPGELSPVIESDDGFYLLKLIESDAEGSLPLSMVELNIRNRLQADRRREAIEALYLEGLKGVKVQVDDDALRAVEAPEAKPGPSSVPPSIPMR